MSSLELVVELFLRIGLFGLSLLLAFLTLFAYGRLRNTKLLLIGLGFLAFTAKAALYVLGVADPVVYRAFTAPTEVLALDFAAIALLYAGTTKT